MQRRGARQANGGMDDGLVLQEEFHNIGAGPPCGNVQRRLAHSIGMTGIDTLIHQQLVDNVKLILLTHH
jgi:hypothetical protein